MKLVRTGREAVGAGQEPAWTAGAGRGEGGEQDPTVLESGVG